MNRPVKGVICVPSAKHYYEVIAVVKPTHSYMYIKGTIMILILDNMVKLFNTCYVDLNYQIAFHTTLYE